MSVGKIPGRSAKWSLVSIQVDIWTLKNQEIYFYTKQYKSRQYKTRKLSKWWSPVQGTTYLNSSCTEKDHYQKLALGY